MEFSGFPDFGLCRGHGRSQGFPDFGVEGERSGRTPFAALLLRQLFGPDVHDFRRGRPCPEGLSKNFVQKSLR